MKNRYIHFTSGKSPVECQFVLANVLKIFMDEMKEKGVQVEVAHRIMGDESEMVRSATLVLSHMNQEGLLDNWLGTILWKEKSQFRKNAKRKNWFVGAYEIEGLTEIEFKDSDLQFQTMRSQGAGGQNVNKVNSAVRVTHLPTGITAFSQDSRSQFQNKKTAIERLFQKLEDKRLDSIQDQIAQKWEQHFQLERGNPVRVFQSDKLKKRKVKKTFKKQRNKLKQELHRDMQWRE